MFLELLVDVEHLADGRVKASEEFAAHDEDVDIPSAKLVFDRFFIGVCIAVAVHHLVPVGDDLIVGALVHVVHAFPKIGRRDHHGALQVAQLLKAFQIPHGVPLVIGSQHGLEAGAFIPLHEVLVDIQRNAPDAGVGGG